MNSARYTIPGKPENQKNLTCKDWYNVLKIFRKLKGKPNYGLNFKIKKKKKKKKKNKKKYI